MTQTDDSSRIRYLLRKLFAGLRTLWFCVANGHLWTLVLGVLIIWLSLYLYARMWRGNHFPAQWAIVHIFDAGSVSQTLSEVKKAYVAYENQFAELSKAKSDKSGSEQDLRDLSEKVEKAKKEYSSARLDAVASIVAFVFAWLLGCGVLLVTILDKRKEYKHLTELGQIMRIPGLCSRRAVFLGWGPSVVTMLRELDRYNSLIDKIGIKAGYKKITSAIIVSEHPADKVRQTLLETLGTLEAYPIDISIIHGEYDTIETFKNIAIDKVSRIFVVGEHEDSHDARVLTFLDKLDGYIGKSKLRTLCQVNIDSLGLYLRLNQDDEMRGRQYARKYNHLDVSYHNFFYDWAERIWSRFEGLKTGNEYPRIRYDINSPSKVVNLVVVGFGQMGMALAIHAATIAHYGDDCQLRITIFDPKINDILPRFIADVPGVADLLHWDEQNNNQSKSIRGSEVDAFVNKDVAFSFYDNDIYSDEFTNFLGAVQRKQELLTIAITFKHSNDVISYALSLGDRMPNGSTILLRQNYAANLLATNKAISPTFLRGRLKRCNVYLFGFKDGTGSGECIRDVLAELAFKKRAEATQDQNHGNTDYYGELTTPMSRWEFRKRIDFLLEVFNSVGIKVVHIAHNEGANGGTNLLHDTSVKDKLMRANHKFWWTGRIIDKRSVKPTMKNFDNLTPEERKIDADQVSLISEQLKVMNYELHIVNADLCRNPSTPLLRQYASEQGDALVASCGVPNARYILGGALGYNASLVGNYDIDLRLLIPDAGKSHEEVRREIDSVRDLLAARAKADPTFKTKFIDEGGTNYIWHTKQIVKVPGIPGNPDVELTWNIQAESTYRSIAEMAARLPKDVIDRYVVEKWNAQQAGKEAYKALKGEWKGMINRLIDKGARKMDDESLRELLDSVASQYSKFLKERK